jgi:hypothetical protein
VDGDLTASDFVLRLAAEVGWLLKVDVEVFYFVCFSVDGELCVDV